MKKKSLEKHVVIKSLSFSTFEAFKARVVYNSVSVTSICLYCPYSKRNKNTDKMFLDGFLDSLYYLSDRIPESDLPGHFCSFFDKNHIYSHWTWPTTCCWYLHITFFCRQRALYLWASITGVCSQTHLRFRPQRSCAWSHSYHFAGKVSRGLSALDLQDCEWFTAVWVSSSVVQGSSRDLSSKKKYGLDANSQKTNKTKTVGPCQTLHFCPRRWRRLCWISFAAIS